VYLTPGEHAAGTLAGSVVAVIDVLRASTTITTALANGARAVVPFDSADEAVERARQLQRDTVLLAGERKMHVIPGFDLGNSPREVTRDVVEGKTLLMATTNGTRALLAAPGAREVVVACFANCAAVVSLLRTALRGGTSVAILCAGQDREFALEDAGCAGRFVRLVTDGFSDIHLNDAARLCAGIDREYRDDPAALFAAAAHGQALRDGGFADDLAMCGAMDTYPIVPVMVDRQIVRLGPDLAR
jgi:2-phosphosulfolactate phosphatase